MFYGSLLCFIVLCSSCRADPLLNPPLYIFTIWTDSSCQVPKTTSVAPLGACVASTFFGGSSYQLYCPSGPCLGSVNPGQADTISVRAWGEVQCVGPVTNDSSFYLNSCVNNGGTTVPAITISRVWRNPVFTVSVFSDLSCQILTGVTEFVTMDVRNCFKFGTGSAIVFQANSSLVSLQVSVPGDLGCSTLGYTQSVAVGNCINDVLGKGSLQIVRSY